MTNDSESRAGQAQSTDSNFVYGENVVYVDGEGGAETVVYEGAAPTGTQHVIRRQDGSKFFCLLVPPQAPAVGRLDVPPINST